MQVIVQSLHLYTVLQLHVTLLEFMCVVCGDKRDAGDIYDLKLARAEGRPQSAHWLAA